jgi:hypothetical protein
MIVGIKPALTVESEGWLLEFNEVEVYKLIIRRL